MESEAKFKTNPFKLDGNKLSVSLGKLNEELKPYAMRVDSPEDIYIDKELTDINKAVVLKINTVDTNNGERSFDAIYSLLESMKVLEDKFEAIPDLVYAAEIDASDLIITLTLNKEKATLTTTYEAGGQLEAELDTKVNNLVDQKLKDTPMEVMELVGLTIPANGQISKKLNTDAKKLAVEHFKKMEKAALELNKPLIAFYAGRKIDLREEKQSPELTYLKTIVVNKLYNKGLDLAGGEAVADKQYVTTWAQNKQIFIMDMIRELARRKQPTYVLTDDAIDEAIHQITVQQQQPAPVEWNKN